MDCAPLLDAGIHHVELGDVLDQILLSHPSMKEGLGMEKDLYK